MTAPSNYIKMLLNLYPCSKVQEILASQRLSHEQQMNAHTFWTECGHRIREKINDDARLEVLLLKTLPRYEGNRIRLFRGENKKRFENKEIGFCWTNTIDTARMFARGLNSCKFGGVLLQYDFQPEQIIAGPSSHSAYLGEDEFTIAPSTLHCNYIVELENHPPSF